MLNSKRDSRWSNALLTLAVAAMVWCAGGPLTMAQEAPPRANQPGRVAAHGTEQPPIHSAGTSTPEMTTLAGGDRMPAGDPVVSMMAKNLESLSAQPNHGSMLQTALLLGALGLAPAVLLMTTCYIRVFVVMSLLRQAIGAQHLPPTQILMALSIFVTALVMAPVWIEVKQQAVDPMLADPPALTWQDACQRGAATIKQFMTRQIDATGNRAAVQVFYQHAATPTSGTMPDRLDDVPIHVILPAFILSELKVAFLLGFQIMLPFLVLDLVVATVTVSLGMVMLPPAMVSLPLKLILFVMVDGWNLVVGMLVQSLAGG